MALDINSVVYSNIDKKPKSILADENISKGDKLKIFKDFNDVTKVKKINGDLSNATRDWSITSLSLTNILGYNGTSNNNNNSLTFSMSNGYAVSVAVNSASSQVILTKEDSNGNIHHSFSNVVTNPSSATQMDCCRLNDTQFLVMCYASSQWYYSVGFINTINFSVSLSAFTAFSGLTSVYCSFSYMSNNIICVTINSNIVYVYNFNGSTFTSVNSNIVSSPSTKSKFACAGLDADYFVGAYFDSSASAITVYLFYFNGASIIVSDSWVKTNNITASSGKISVAKVNSNLALVLFGNVIYSVSVKEGKFIVGISNFVLGNDYDFLSVLDENTALACRYASSECRIISLKNGSMNMGATFTDSSFINNTITGGAKLLTKYIISGSNTSIKLVVRGINLSQGSSVKNMEAVLPDINTTLDLSTIDLTFSGVGSRYHICRQVDTNKWVLLRQNVSTNFYYLCTLTIVNGTIVKGTDYLLNTTYFAGTTYKNVNMVKTSANKVVLATNYSNYVHYCMATISGMDITISSITANAHYLANANYTVEMTETNTDNKAIITYHYSSSYYYAILDTSGSTVSVSGSTIDSNGGNGASYPCLIKHIGNNKIITWYINASSQNTCRLYNFNGTDISSVNTSTTSIDASNRYGAILPFSDSKFILASQTHVRLYDIVTNTITYRSVISSLNCYSFNEEFKYDSNNIYVLGQDSTNNVIYYNFYYSGNTLLYRTYLIYIRSSINQTGGLVSSFFEVYTNKGIFALVDSSVYGVVSASAISKKYCNLTSAYLTANYNAILDKLYTGTNYSYLPNSVKTFKLSSTKTLIVFTLNGVASGRIINDDGSVGDLVTLGNVQYTNNTAPDQYSVCVIDSSTFIYVRHNGSTAYCRVCTVSNDIITANTEYSVSGNTQIRNVGLAKLSSNRFALCLDSGSASYNVRSYVGTISGTTISFGSAYDYSITSYSEQYNNFQVVAVDTDKFVIFTATTTTSTILGVCTANGNVITYNSSTPTTVVNGSKFKAILIDTNKIAVFGFHTNSTINGRIITIDGTSYTQGNIFSSSCYIVKDNYSGVDIEKLSSTSFIFSAVGIASSYISNWAVGQRPNIAFVGRINISGSEMSFDVGAYMTNLNIISSYYGSNIGGFIVTADSKIYSHIEGYSGTYGCLVQFKFLDNTYLYGISGIDSGFKTFTGTLSVSTALGAIQVDHNFVIPFSNGTNTKIVAYDIINGFTYGSEAILLSSSANLINVARMNSSKACVIACVGGTMYVCSVSAVGSNVSVGSNTTSANIHATCYFADVLKHNEDTIVVFYPTVTNGYPVVRAFTIGTSSVTAHTETAVENTAIRVGALNQPICAYAIDANRGIVAYLMSASNTIKVAFYTINYANSKSISYTFLTDLNYTSFINSQYFDLFKIYSYDTNKFLLAFIQNGALMLRTIKFTGSTFTELKTNIVGIKNDASYKPVMFEFKKGIYYLMTADGNNNYQKIIDVNLNTDEILVSNDVKFPNIGFMATSFGMSNYDDDTFKDKLLLGYADNDSKFMHFKIINVPEYYNFNAIAEENANSGNFVKVSLAGQFTEALTGLMPGRVVYMDKFSLRNVYTKDNAVMLGLAHNESKLLLANTDEQIEFLNNKIK